MLTVAAAPFKIPNARTIGGGIRSCGWLIRKFSKDLSVCAPQYLSDGTWISPKASVSVLVEEAILAVVANVLMLDCRLSKLRCGKDKGRVANGWTRSGHVLLRWGRQARAAMEGKERGAIERAIIAKLLNCGHVGSRVQSEKESID